MLVSYRYNFVFIKTFRCGSTSVEIGLQHLCLPDGSEELPLDTGEVVTPAGIVGSRKIRIKDSSATPFFNHMTACAIRKEIGATKFSSFTKIAVVRNPYDQIVSWFFHRIRAKISEFPLYRNKSAPEQFRLWLNSPAPHLPSYWSMLSLEGECVIDKVIRFENIQADFQRIYAELAPEVDKGSGDLPVLRQGPQGKRNYREMYDDTSRELVSIYFERELKEFGYDF